MSFPYSSMHSYMHSLIHSSVNQSKKNRMGLSKMIAEKMSAILHSSIQSFIILSSYSFIHQLINIQGLDDFEQNDRREDGQTFIHSFINIYLSVH